MERSGTVKGNKTRPQTVEKQPALLIERKVSLVLSSGNSNLPGKQWNGAALRRLVWPLMVEQLLVVTIGMADTVMVASVGEAAVSGISLVDAINLLLITAFSALATGGAVVVSQYLGRRDTENANLAARQLTYTITAASLLIMGAALLLGKPLLSLIYGHIETDVMANAEIYFTLSAASYPFLALYTAGAALFRSMGNSKVSMLISLLVNLVNIGGNAFLIYGMGWGVAGAATASLVSRIIAALFIMRLLLAPAQQPVSLRGLWRPRFAPDMVRSILKIGIPNGLETSMFQIGKLMVARIVSTFGTAAIAGNAIASVLASFVNLPGQAIGLALLTVVGQCVGAQNYEGARKNTGRLMKATFLSMAAMGVVILLLAKPMLRLFGLSPEAFDIAYRCIVLFCLSVAFFWPQSFALPNALRAAGDARFTMVVSVASMWIFRIGFAYLLALALGWGVLGVWAAMVIDWVVRGTLFLLRWRSGRWKNFKVIS